ncbi:MAG: endonuclease/exonuclease/phosphatase family protein, partial [Acidimicrobiia bacterium]
VQFVLLFLYYTSTGSAVMLGVAWAGLVAAAVVSTLTLPASLRTQPIRLRPAALPALAILALLIAAPLGRSLADSDPQGERVLGDRLRVMTYNIQSGFSKDNVWDLEATARVIEAADPDVVFLQEVSRGWLVTTGNDQLRWLSQRLDMPYAWGPASTDDLWGNAILSHYPIASEQVVKYDSSDNLRRSALAVGIEVGDGRILNLIGTHLDNPGEAGLARAGQVAQLVELLEPGQPAIVAGDFNATPDDVLIVDMASVGLIDSAPQAGADETTSEDGRRIDYIFVTSEFDVLDGQVIPTDASDHRPLVVTLALP